MDKHTAALLTECKTIFDRIESFNPFVLSCYEEKAERVATEAARQLGLTVPEMTARLREVQPVLRALRKALAEDK